MGHKMGCQIAEALFLMQRFMVSTGEKG